MCMDRQEAALSAPVLAWAHSMLIKPLQITSDISPIITCQSFFFLLYSQGEFSAVLCECAHMGAWEPKANLFQHADCGFNFCLLYPLSCAFSLKVESLIFHNIPARRTHRNTDRFVQLGVFFWKQNFFIDCVDLFSYCCCHLINHYVWASSS